MDMKLVVDFEWTAHRWRSWVNCSAVLGKLCGRSRFKHHLRLRKSLRTSPSLEQHASTNS
eukprot:5851406-Pleurochrysis_carterae.AAC.1